MRWVLCLLVVLGAVPVMAQPATSYTLKVFNQGASLPMTTTPIPAASFLCNQVVPDTSNTANPTKVVFDDPANVGKVCLYTDSGTGPLLSLPFGSGVYVSTLAVVNSAGTSPESALSNPFTRPGAVGAVPTGVRVFR